jgi:protein arginine N-methyltransferase 1
MYKVEHYGRMIADDVRMGSYARAMEELLKPNSVVLDIGTGTGICALLACRLGARRVYAVEPSDVICIAREAARENGFSDRIEFIQDVSTQITLREPADLVVSDLRGVLPPFERHIPAIIDARDRLLAPDGVLIPQRDVLYAAVVEAPRIYDGYLTPWRSNHHGVSMRAAEAVATNSGYNVWLRPEELLAPPQVWAAIDYPTVISPDVRGTASLTTSRAGTGHGIAIWFDTYLGGSASFSNAPGEPPLIYGSMFFPWPRPVELGVGSGVSVTIHADLVGGGYIWRWDTCISEGDRSSKSVFRQSTFSSASASPYRLRKRASTHRPTLSEKGEIDRQILLLMDGQTSLEEITSRVVGLCTNHALNRQDVGTRARELSEKYSR